ncbi:FtsH protease activity modulator HflK [Psittacicella melopsittaci]|uniref:Protein HflK n=1 Tax=Psittacicella melopsittaci TaxID=2028576 RepID=A0A3A1Y7T6_9GAMM|nr:FtsH protease activity modulator HflK [Psittacicella melopsittaci]RIY33591.1 FtsH protease activity modulator HflK [Psittacicella melopsittaci]
MSDEKDNKSSDELSRELKERLKKFRELAGNNKDDEESTSNSEPESETSNNQQGTKKTFNQTNRSERREDNTPEGSRGSAEKKSFSMPNLSEFNFGKHTKTISLSAVGLFLVLFVVSGFYTVNESERGVITRFGAYNKTSLPGLNWKVPVIDKANIVNVQRVSELRIDGTMLTRDENVVNVTLTVQYRVDDPVKYLFNVDQPITTLEEATEASLRYVVGHMDMDDVITTGRSEVRENTRQMLLKTLDSYNVGIGIVDVNFQSARPPEEVKEAFDDAIKAQEDEQRFIREAEAYQRSREPIARGQAQQLLEQARGYAAQTVAQANAEAAKFNNLLPLFVNNPQVFKQRYYLETLASLYAETPKVIMQDTNGITFLPLDKLLENVGKPATTDTTQPGSLLLNSSTSSSSSTNTSSSSSSSSSSATPTTNSSSNNSSRQAPSRFVTRGGN